MALAVLSDYEPDEAAKFCKTVLPLGFGYRVIRFQNGVSKSNTFWRPVIAELLGGLVKYAAVYQACFCKHCLNVLRCLNCCVVAIGIHSRVRVSSNSLGNLQK